jgi:hypothetical protein
VDYLTNYRSSRLERQKRKHEWGNGFGQSPGKEPSPGLSCVEAWIEATALVRQSVWEVTRIQLM